MTDQQSLKIICLQTALTAYHYQSFSNFKDYLQQKIRAALNAERAQRATLVVLPECTGSWFYFMSVPMIPWLRSYFFNDRSFTNDRHLWFIIYTLIIYFRCFIVELLNNFWSTPSWFSLFERAWFSMFSDRSFSLYQRLFSQLAQETNCTIIAGSIFRKQFGLRNVCYVFEPNEGSICLESGKIYLVDDEIAFLDRSHENGKIYSIPKTNVDIAVLICADSWMPETYRFYERFLIEKNRRFLFIIVALNLGEWNIPWPGYDRNSTTPDDVDRSDVENLSLSDAWIRYSVERAFNSLEKHSDRIEGYGVICCQGILNLMNDIRAQGESFIMIRRKRTDEKIFLRSETFENEKVFFENF